MNPILNPKWLSRLTTNWLQPSSFLRFLGLLVIFNLAYNAAYSQANTSFENATTSNVRYTDTGNPAVMHALINNAGQSMPNATGAGSELGYSATFTPTRTNTSGSAGLTDGDWLGAYDRTATGGNTGDVSINLSAGNDPPPDGDNVYIFEDPDGTVTLEFDPVLLNSPGIMFSMWYIINSSGYENSDGMNDIVRITLDFQSATPDIDLLNTIGGDIDDLGLDTENWTQLTQDLSAFMGETVKLVVQVDFNSGSEEMHIDHINFTGGTIVSSCTDAAPPTIACPSTQTRNMDASCNYTVEDFTGLATTSDDCGPVTVTQSPTAGGTLSTLGNTSIVLTATDGAANTAQCSFTLTLQDVTAPTVSCPATQATNLDATCSLNIPDYTSLGSASDNCDGSPTITQVPTPGTTVSGVGISAISLVATDASGNSSSCTFAMNRVDATVPSITCPVTQTVPLDANCQSSHNNYTGLASVSDNCDASPVVTQSPPDGTLITANTSATLIVTDASGNSTSCTFMVMVSDNNAPSITCPGTQIETGNANCEGTLSDYTGLATTSDNCDASPTVTQSPTSGNSFTGNTTVTLTATDASSNSTTCTFTVMVSDNTMPSITCPGNQTRQVDALCNYALEDLTGLVSTSDNCDASPTVTQNPVVGFTPGTTGAIPMTMTATDAAGNSAQCNFLVIMEDNIAPSITCPGTQIEPGNANCEVTLPNYIALASAGDNCPGISISQSPVPGTTITGNTTVTLTATDASGNSTTCTFMVEVLDNTPPTAMCVGGGMMVDQTNNLVYGSSAANMGSNWQSAQSLTVGVTGSLNKVRIQLRPGSSLADITLSVLDGNTPNAPQTVLTTETITPGSLNPMFVLSSPVNVTAGQQITLLFSSSSRSDIVCVVGNSYTGGERWFSSNFGASYSGPFPHDLDFTTYVSGGGPEVCLDASGNATLNAAILNDGSTDNCGPVTFSASPNMFTCSDIGSQSVTLVVTDQAGLSSSCTTTVEVKDKLAPTAVCTDVTVDIQPDMTASVSVSQIASGSFDNCGFVSISISAGETNFNCDDNGMVFPVTVMVSDASGNSTSCTQNVTVDDPNSYCCAPADAVCMNTTVQLDASGNATITAADVDGGSTTECGFQSMTVSPNAFTCADVGSGNMVTLTVTDVNGDSDACTAMVTVEDNVAPDAQCKPVTVQLNAGGSASITAADINNGSSDACGIGSMNINGFPSVTLFCVNIGQNNMAQLNVTDVNGNTASCLSAITVEDNVAPTAVCQNTTVMLDANGNGSITAADVDGGSSDACGIASLAVSPNSFTCSDLGSNTVVLTVTDVNGNTAQCGATVTVEDNLPPNPVCLNPTVYLKPDGTYALQDVDVLDFINTTDNCNFFISNISPATVDCDDFNTIVPVTVTVSDDSGNTAQCTAMVDVQKGTALPAGWGNADIGGATGAAEYDPCEETFCVQSNGISFPTSDKIHMAYQYLCASQQMEVIARVVSVTPAHGLGGIMIRETLDGGAKKVALKTQLNGSYFVQRDSRTMTNGFAQTQQIFRPGVTWLRIVRNGNQFLMYTSNNGMAWSFAAFANVNMNSCVYIGLFTEGTNDNVTTTACFDNVSVTGGSPLPLVDGGDNWNAETTRAVDFAVFPNPAVNEVNIDLSQFENDTFTMKVYNNLGQLVFRKEYLYLDDYLETLDVSQYSNGIYLINIELEDGTLLNKKLVVNKK